jgi:suppressor of tumorigenicity protein 13
VIDWDASAASKEQANDAKASGNYEDAVKHFTAAMTTGQVSAMTLANRAECLLKMRRPRAAISDCDAALAMNPDSAKALR